MNSTLTFSSSRFSKWQKIQDKNLNILRTKELLRWKSWGCNFKFMLGRDVVLAKKDVLRWGGRGLWPGGSMLSIFKFQLGFLKMKYAEDMWNRKLVLNSMLSWVGQFFLRDFQVFLSLALSLLTFLFRLLLITSFHEFVDPNFLFRNHVLRPNFADPSNHLCSLVWSYGPV